MLAKIPAPAVLPRRNFLFDSLNVALSVTAVAMLSGCAGLSNRARRSDGQAASDVRILSTTLAAEREAVAAYQLGADRGLLGPGVLKLAVRFQDHHKRHADLLVVATRRLGGEPHQPPARYDFRRPGLKRQQNVLEFADGLERGAVSACAGAVPLFAECDLTEAAARILADEAMHWAVLHQALGLDPVPGSG